MWKKAPGYMRKFEWYLPHQAWLMEKSGTSRHDPEGASARCADLRGADFRRCLFSSADLRGADFKGTDLSDAFLSGADLRGADLRGADLSDADLYGADLSGANLRGSDLRDVHFIYRSVFTGCNLSGAQFSVHLIQHLAKNYPAEYLGYALGLGIDGELDVE